MNIYESYLNCITESINSSNVISKLNAAYKLADTENRNMMYTSKKFRVPKDFKVIKGIISNVKSKNLGLCYSNALDLAKSNKDYALFAGIVVDPEELDMQIKFMQSDPSHAWHPESINLHAWNMFNGKVFDCTYGTNKNLIYIGIKLDENKFNSDNQVESYIAKKSGLFK